MKPEYSDQEIPDTEVFLIECLSWGLLRAYGIEEPPVPVREMIKQPLPIFEHLALLELNLGLYDATYKSCLNGSRLIVVDLVKSRTVQRAGMARALYMAFCCSPCAAKLGWPRCKQPYVHSDLFSRCLLMPAAWVRTACAEAIPTVDVAARFDVPVRMVARRLNEMDCCTLSPGVAPFAHGVPGSPGDGCAVTQSLATSLFSLKEPWRGRFLDLVANLATNWTWGSQRPTQEDVAVWLGADLGLYRDIKLLLDVWRRPKRFYYLHQWKFDISVMHREMLRQGC